MKISDKIVEHNTQVHYSLSAMRQAKAEMNTLVDLPQTPGALIERIELCEHLLRELANVQTSLVLHLKYTRAVRTSLSLITSGA